MYRELDFEAIAGTCMYVNCPINQYRHSATLLYLKKMKEDEFRWYQVAFKHSPMGSQKYDRTSPFCLEPENYDIYLALSNTLHVIEVEYRPQQIDNDNYQKFEKFWCNLLAEAATGKLRER